VIDKIRTFNMNWSADLVPPRIHVFEYAVMAVAGVVIDVSADPPPDLIRQLRVRAWEGGGLLPPGMQPLSVSLRMVAIVILSWHIFAPPRLFRRLVIGEWHRCALDKTITLDI
jgi:hypothetical protein